MAAIPYGLAGDVRHTRWHWAVTTFIGLLMARMAGNEDGAGIGVRHLSTAHTDYRRRLSL